MSDQKIKFVVDAEDKSKTALKGVSLRLNKLKVEAKAVGSSLKSIVTPVAAVAAGLAYMGKRAIDNADNLAKMSDRIGASVTALSEYQHVAKLSGVEFNTLTMGWQRMTRRVAEAARGTGEAKDALRELNIDAKELNKLAPEDQFEAITGALQGVEDPADKVRLAMKLFDSEGVSLIQTMKGGVEGLKEMREQAKALGISLSQDQADAAVKAKDAMAELSSVSDGLGVVIMGALAPALTDLFKYLTDNIPVAIEKTKNAFLDMEDWVGDFQIRLSDFLFALSSSVPGVLSLATAYGVSGRAAKQYVEDQRNVTETTVEATGEIEEQGNTFSRTNQQLIAYIDSLKKEFMTNQQKAAEVTGWLNDALDRGIISLETYKNLQAEVSAKFASDVGEPGVSAMDSVEEGVKALSNSFSSGLGVAIDDTTKKLIDLETIGKRTLSSLISSFAFFGVGAGLNAIFPGSGLISKIFGRASGGPVNADQPYIVGEQGPELIIPRSSGTVIPNSGLAGATNNITHNINLVVEGVSIDDPLVLRRITEKIVEETAKVNRTYALT